MINCKGCRQNTVPMNCAGMQRKLQMLDFAIVETTLYLDAYPDCRKALEYYHTLIAEREALAQSIHAQCGPTTAWDNKSTTSWDWISGPWPWEFDAN